MKKQIQTRKKRSKGGEHRISIEELNKCSQFCYKNYPDKYRIWFRKTMKSMNKTDKEINLRL